MTDPIIRTHSGLLVNVLDPDPELIRLGDIAHALSFVNRFGGHTPQPYSVAEHSILVASEFIGEPKAYRTALLHDAPEYVLGDMVGPLKHSFVGESYRKLEAVWEQVLTKKFDLYPLNDEFRTWVKERDKEQFEWERTFVVNNPCRVAPNPHDVKFQFATLARTKGECRG